jgi:hypothetical protein
MKISPVKLVALCGFVLSATCSLAAADASLVGKAGSLGLRQHPRLATRKGTYPLIPQLKLIGRLEFTPGSNEYLSLGDRFEPLVRRQSTNAWTWRR